MQRIDPRQPRPEEAAIVRPACAECLEIDVAQYKPRQDEEDLDPQIALGHRMGQDTDVEVRPEGIDHHPGRSQKAQRRQGAEIGGAVEFGR